ncbi:hypothetical protein [Nonomuraea typhae]|uniref:hypothetical protein n=1 Tax=Nonomuraea typhae TaxID=2603600 RepID=UPI0012F86B67|nr:hypothetical protein [Nonomuraea typhae]
MNPVIEIAVALLVIFALVRASIIEPPASARDPRQYRARLRSMRWWQPAYWIAAVMLVAPLITAWNALRFAAYLAAFLTACASVRLANATAMDGRAIRVYRASPWREFAP